MANKTVENPCDGSGQPFIGEIVTAPSGKRMGTCSECMGAVTVNKRNNMARKHEASTTSVGTADILQVKPVISEEQSEAISMV